MNESCATENVERFEAALLRFDEENSHDPNQEKVEGKSVAREVVYAQWLSDWVLRLQPAASEALRLAARCAHLCRWAIARETYPMTRAGYLRWRQELKSFHAAKVGVILREVGYGDQMIERVQGLVSKSVFPKDPDSRVLEDALCLVFLERQFAALADRSTDEKMINALQKTWKKMTPAAQEIARTLELSSREKSLLERALEL